MRLTSAEFMRIAKAIADPLRCEILERTASMGELSCSAIVAQFSVSQATISHHLKELATAGLLARRKEGQFAHYSFRPEVMSAYLTELTARLHLEAPLATLGGEGVSRSQQRLRRG